jgi:transposase
VISVERWAEIRRLYWVEHLSQRAIARRLGMHRKSVWRAIHAKEVPRYRCPPRPSILDPYKPLIENMLREEPRLSGVRIKEQLEAEGYQGGITILRDYLVQVRPRFLPPPAYQRSEYLPGAIGQVDWAEMPDRVEGEKVFAFCMVLGYSRLLYVEFCRRAGREQFLRAHRRALEYFGGSPRTVAYDNLKTVVQRRCGRQVAFDPIFLGFAGTYCFAPHACWPGEPHEKGLVERPIGYLKKNFWAGRRFRDFTDLQAQGRTWLEQANRRLHATLRERPLDRWAQERSHLLPLPPVPYDTDGVAWVRVSRDGFVRFDTNDYSVPPGLAGQLLEVRAQDATVRVLRGGIVIAAHHRCYRRHQTIYDAAHQEAVQAWRVQRTRVLPAPLVEIEVPELSCYDRLVPA